MPKIKIKVTADDIEQADSSGDFELPPAGFYTATLKECKPGYKKVDGAEDKNSPRIECTYSIDGVGKEGKDLDGKNYGRLWDYITFSEASGWKRVEFLRAMGLPPQKGGDFEVDTDELVNKRVIVKVKHEPDRQNPGEIRARLANTYPFEDEDANAAFGAGSGSADEDDSSPFGGGDDDAEDGDFLTDDELRAMDLKELGAVAKDFDIDPNDFVKKVRGKNKVDTDGLIESILEAQGDTEDAGDGDEDDDESPF